MARAADVERHFVYGIGRPTRAPDAQGAAATLAPLSLEEAWETCRDLYEGLAWKTSTMPNALHDELLFCLLGGFGVSYELNRSAADAIAELDPFNAIDDEGLRRAVESVLSEPRFEPRRSDGSLRRYRFPARKAKLIVDASHWLRSQQSVSEQLDAMSCDRERRTFLCTCPGVGPKTASWVLRNVGLATELAILDIHLLRALRHSGRLDASVRLPRDYAEVEQTFLSWCAELNADPAAFDLFVWEWQRGSFAK
jgi:N-glycosylase/DNA lyase